MWSSTESFLEYAYDGDNNDRDWSVKELTNEASLFEGIILTRDSGRHDIPIGGGIIRTSSAIAMSPWLPEHPPLRDGENWAVRYLVPYITDQIYAPNPLLEFLKRQPRKRMAIWTPKGWVMLPYERKYGSQVSR